MPPGAEKTVTATKGANPARRHHYLPECYQRLWASDDGKVERFWIGHAGKLMARRLAPAGVGWAPGLYDIPGEKDVWEAQRVETEFFAPLDAAAAPIMRAMIKTCSPPRSSEDRTAWAMFVLAFLHRTPEHLSATLSKLAELNAELMPEVEERYAELKGPGDPPTFREWEAQRSPDSIERSTLRSIMDLISNPKAGPYIVNLHWAVIDLSDADHGLMVGDNPVVLVPLQTPDGHLAIPLGPERLFVASEHSNLVRGIAKSPPRRTVRAVNRLMVERASEVVIAADRTQEPFVHKHFGTCRIGSLATGLHQPQRTR